MELTLNTQRVLCLTLEEAMRSWALELPLYVHLTLCSCVYNVHTVFGRLFCKCEISIIEMKSEYINYIQVVDVYVR